MHCDSFILLLSLFFYTIPHNYINVLHWTLCRCVSMISHTTVFMAEICLMWWRFCAIFLSLLPTLMRIMCHTGYLLLLWLAMMQSTHYLQLCVQVLVHVYIPVIVLTYNTEKLICNLSTHCFSCVGNGGCMLWGDKVNKSSMLNMLVYNMASLSQHMHTWVCLLLLFLHPFP